MPGRRGAACEVNANPSPVHHLGSFQAVPGDGENYLQVGLHDYRELLMRDDVCPGIRPGLNHFRNTPYFKNTIHLASSFVFVLS